MMNGAGVGRPENSGSVTRILNDESNELNGLFYDCM